MLSDTLLICQSTKPTDSQSLCFQGHLEGMIGKPSGYIESLPKALRNRLAYLGELQDQHDDLAEKHHEEQVALQRKYEKLWGKHSPDPTFTRMNSC